MSLFFFLRKILFHNSYFLRSLWLLICFFSALAAATPTSTTDLETGLSIEVNSLSLEAKVGQLFILGVPEKSMTPDLKKFIQLHQPGGFVLFKRNIADLQSFQKFTQSLNSESLSSSKILPFIAADEEGGKVSRLPFFPRLPSAQDVAKSKDPGLAFDLGFEVGTQMIKYGLNLNLAPVLDLSDHKGFLGSRSYSKNPQITSLFGVQYAKGLFNSGVMPSAKHFPGMGNSSTDPHINSGIFVYKNKSEFQSHVIPFLHFIKKVPVSSLMISHFIYPQVEPDTPAVFSKNLYAYLRNKVRYEGLLITDDLQMSAITNDPGSKSVNKYTDTRSKPQKSKVPPLEENVFRALSAGADIVMISWSRPAQVKTHKYLVELVKNGTFKEEDLNQKVYRILKHKNSINQSPSQEAEPLRKIASTKTELAEAIENKSQVTSENLKNLQLKLKLKGDLKLQKENSSE